MGFEEGYASMLGGLQPIGKRERAYGHSARNLIVPVVPGAGSACRVRLETQAGYRADPAGVNGLTGALRPNISSRCRCQPGCVECQISSFDC